MDTKYRVLAVGAHPDDIEIRCGGTLARYAQEGHHVMMAYATNGEKGHRTIPPAELATIRERESRAAAAVIGAEVFWLKFPDAELFYDKETRLVFVDMIRQARPDIILTHWREAYHPDHMITSELVCGASYLSTVPHVKTNHPPCAKIPRIYYFEVEYSVEDAASEYVDVTGVYDLKRKMLSAHESQFVWLKENHDVDIMARMEMRDRGDGAKCGVAFAEHFVARGFRPGVRLLP